MDLFPTNSTEPPLEHANPAQYYGIYIDSLPHSHISVCLARVRCALRDQLLRRSRGKLFLGGTLSGSVGLIKTGGGTNTLGGGFSNTYGGSTTVTNGLLELSKFGSTAAAIPHDLIIGQNTTPSTVRNLAGAEIADVSNVTANRLSTWDLDDHSETIS